MSLPLASTFTVRPKYSEATVWGQHRFNLLFYRYIFALSSRDVADLTALRQDIVR